MSSTTDNAGQPAGSMGSVPGDEPAPEPSVGSSHRPDARDGVRAQGPLPVRDRLAAAAIDALARWTPYVESEIRGLRHLVPPGAVCVDVGAAGGIYTMALSRLVGPAGRVHSVEPLRFANLPVARVLNVGRAANVCQHTVALGADPGIDLMSVPVGRFGLVTGRSFLNRRAGGPDPNLEFTRQIAVTVSVDTLDAMCARERIERLDFVKIDVEGAELEVLEGGKKTIAAHRPSILVEIEARHAARYGRSPEEVVAWLVQRGYSMHTWHHGWQPTSAIAADVRNYLFRSLDRGLPASACGPSLRMSAPV